MTIYLNETAMNMASHLGRFDWVDMASWFGFADDGEAERYFYEHSVEVCNLTPHAVNLEIDGKMVEIPSEGIARASAKTEEVGRLGSIRLTRTVYGEPEGLPAPVKGVYLIVSSLTASAAEASGRTTEDLLLPSESVRDAEGYIVGCRSLGIV